MTQEPPPPPRARGGVPVTLNFFLLFSDAWLRRSVTSSPEIGHAIPVCLFAIPTHMYAMMFGTTCPPSVIYASQAANRATRHCVIIQPSTRT